MPFSAKQQNTKSQECLNQLMPLEFAQIVTLTVPGFPWKTTFSLVVCWHPGEPGEPDDTDGYLYVNFLDPHFKKLSYVLRTKPEYKTAPDAEPKVKNKGLLILPIKDLPLEIPGKYTIDLSYGGKSKWTTFMTIQEAQKDM